eukprot:403334906
MQSTPDQQQKTANETAINFIKQLKHKDSKIRFEGYDEIDYKDHAEKEEIKRNAQGSSKWQLFSKMLFSQKIKINDATIQQAEREIQERDKEEKQKKQLDELAIIKHMQMQRSKSTSSPHKMSERVQNLLQDSTNQMMSSIILPDGSIKKLNYNIDTRQSHSPDHRNKNRNEPYSPIKIKDGQGSQAKQFRLSKSKTFSKEFLNKHLKTVQQQSSENQSDYQEGSRPQSFQKRRQKKVHDDKKKITMDDIQIQPFNIRFLKAKMIGGAALEDYIQENFEESNDSSYFDNFQALSNAAKNLQQKATFNGYQNYPNKLFETDQEHAQKLRNKMIRPYSCEAHLFRFTEPVQEAFQIQSQLHKEKDQEQNLNQELETPQMNIEIRLISRESKKISQQDLTSEVRNKRNSQIKMNTNDQDSDLKIVEFFRRRSCICTHCFGKEKKYQPKFGETIVLQEEREMITNFCRKMKNQNRISDSDFDRLASKSQQLRSSHLNLGVHAQLNQLRKASIRSTNYEMKSMDQSSNLQDLLQKYKKQQITTPGQESKMSFGLLDMKLSQSVKEDLPLNYQSTQNLNKYLQQNSQNSSQRNIFQKHQLQTQQMQKQPQINQNQQSGQQLSKHQFRNQLSIGNLMNNDTKGQNFTIGQKNSHQGAVKYESNLIGKVSSLQQILNVKSTATAMNGQRLIPQLGKNKEHKQNLVQLAFDRKLGKDIPKKMLTHKVYQIQPKKHLLLETQNQIPFQNPQFNQAKFKTSRNPDKFNKDLLNIDEKDFDYYNSPFRISETQDHQIFEFKLNDQQQLTYKIPNEHMRSQPEMDRQQRAQSQIDEIGLNVNNKAYQKLNKLDKEDEDTKDKEVQNTLMIRKNSQTLSEIKFKIKNQEQKILERKHQKVKNQCFQIQKGICALDQLSRQKDQPLNVHEINL